jgi:tetratricopeptide (TPR) repeat protein
MAFTNTNRAKILVRLGRDEEARQLLDELFKTINEEKGSYLQLLPELQLIKAELSLSEGNRSQAIESATEAVGIAPAGSEIMIESKYFLGLLKGDAKKLCAEAVDAASKAGFFGLHSRALLAAAEAALKGNDAQTALSLAEQAQERFSRGGLLESEWRAWIIASRASEQLGDKLKRDEMWKNATDARSRLEQQWSADTFKRFRFITDNKVDPPGSTPKLQGDQTMSDTNPDAAEPTEDQPGGSTVTTPSDSASTAPAEPTENQPGGGSS